MCVYLFFFVPMCSGLTRSSSSAKVSVLTITGRKLLIELFHVDGSARPKLSPETAIFISGKRVKKQMEDNMLSGV